VAHATLLTLEQAAAQLHRSPDTLRYWRKNGTGPRSFRMGRRVMYAQEDIDAFVAAAREADGQVSAVRHA